MNALTGQEFPMMWTCGDLGEGQREVTFEPFPVDVPVSEPVAPAVPDRELVPAP